MGFVFWKILKYHPDFVKAIEASFHFNEAVSKILAGRFNSLEQIESNFNCCNLESPFAMLNMELAVERLKQAIFKKECVAIYGDYDCDGVCSTAMLFSYLKRFDVDVVCHIPTRGEGYGLNTEAIRMLKSKGVNLIITVDNGIKAVEEALLVESLGMELIITDHHNVASCVPKAVAVLNPKQPGDLSKFKEICGAVVVLKLIAAMEGGDFDYAFNFAGDLAAIATVADLVPLVNENRVVVSKGLSKLNNAANLGLAELLNLVFPTGTEQINSTDLAFKVCPVINAAGRVKSPKLAFELLACCSKTETVKQQAKELVQLNFLRKQIQQELTKKALAFIAQNASCLSLRVLVVYGKKWPSGLIGLVAGSLLQKFKKPVVVLTIENDVAVGSARSFESFKIFDALNYCSSLFLKWGGHDFAGGLTLKASNIKQFVFKINEFAKTKTFAFLYKADLVAVLSSVNFSFVEQLKALEPFGKFNEQPTILFKNLKLLKIVQLKQGVHMRLEFEQNGFKASVLAFNTSFSDFHHEPGKMFNLLAQVETNQFQGSNRLVFKLIDLRPAKLNQHELVESFTILNELDLKTNLQPAQIQKFKPVRADFVLTFLALKKIKTFNGSFFQFFCLLCDRINCFKLFVVLKVFEELGLVNFNGLEIKMNEIEKEKPPLKLENSKRLKEWFN